MINGSMWQTVWQSSLIALAAAASFGWFGAAVVRLFSRRAATRAALREGTALESGLVGAAVPAGERAFDAWAYRVGARFAGRIRVVVRPTTITIAGPRVPRGLYRAWIVTQSLLLAAVPPLVVAAVVTGGGLLALLGLGAFVFSWLVSSLGAGLWPGLGEFESLETGGRFRALEVPRASVHEVDVGPGWSKGGLDVVLLPYVRALNAMVGPRPVSFFGPDEDGLEVRFALHMFSDDAARTLAGLLRSPRSVEAGERSSPGGGAPT